MQRFTCTYDRSIGIIMCSRKITGDIRIRGNKQAPKNKIMILALLNFDATELVKMERGTVRFCY